MKVEQTLPDSELFKAKLSLCQEIYMYIYYRCKFVVEVIINLKPWQAHIIIFNIIMCIIYI